MLTEAGTLRVNTLAERLRVTGATIRNDLRKLEREGVVERTHGGVNIRTEYLAKRQYASISDSTRPAHQFMAEWVLEQIRDGEPIFLDDCGTASYLVPLLDQRQHLKVFTNGIHIASALAHNEQHQVFLVGGRVSTNGRRVLGNLGCDMLSTMHIQTAVISPDGYTSLNGMTQNEYETAQAKAGYISQATRVIAVVEQDRFNTNAVVSIPGIRGVDILLTDAHVENRLIDEITRQGTMLITCRDGVYNEFPACHPVHEWKIGFANLSDSLPFCRQVRLSLEQAAAAAGTHLVVLDNRMDINQAMANVDDMIAANVDLVIEFQLFEHLGGVIMNKLRAAGIPVIAVDVPMVGATFFGGDNYNAGRLAGEALGQWTNNNWHNQVDAVLLLEDKRTGEVVAARLYGQLEGLRKHLSIPEESVHHLDGCNQPDIALKNVKAWLASHPHLNHVAILSHNDDAAFGAIQAARELDREDHVAIVGQGCDENIRTEIRSMRSRVIGSTAWWPEKYGHELHQLAEKILKGESVPPAIHLNHIFINRENIEQFYPFESQDINQSIQPERKLELP
ncbi:MAG: substrate-binding domain-containing protein [Anaerolineae bacterium]|nr:substrate-binding domain-containing protein [Anaerolineae bacterium]